MLGKKLIVTGGFGALGTELNKLLPNAKRLNKNQLDVTDRQSIEVAIEQYKPEPILHLAAYTSVPKAEQDRVNAYLINVGGTHYLATACQKRDIKLIYISSDYVFDGEEGQYVTGAVRNPLNWYGFTKAEGERVVEKYPHHCIIRTSFKPSVFPYSKAFEDLWTSADYIDIIAPMIAENLDRTGKIHVGTERKTIFELAKRRKHDVKPMFRTEISDVVLPRDVSLNCNEGL